MYCSSQTHCHCKYSWMPLHRTNPGLVLASLIVSGVLCQLWRGAASWTHNWHSNTVSPIAIISWYLPPPPPILRNLSIIKIIQNLVQFRDNPLVLGVGRAGQLSPPPAGLHRVFQTSQPVSRVWLWLGAVRCQVCRLNMTSPDTLCSAAGIFSPDTWVRSDHNGCQHSVTRCQNVAIPCQGSSCFPLFCNRNRFISRNHLKQFQLISLQCDDPVSPQCQPHKYDLL